MTVVPSCSIYTRYNQIHVCTLCCAMSMHVRVSNVWHCVNQKRAIKDKWFSHACISHKPNATQQSLVRWCIWASTFKANDRWKSWKRNLLHDSWMTVVAINLIRSIWWTTKQICSYSYIQANFFLCYSSLDNVHIKCREYCLITNFITYMQQCCILHLEKRIF